MRRFIALLVMLVVPLQFAWAAAMGVHGHAAQNVAATGFHSHGHEHGHAGDAEAHQGDAHHDRCAPVDPWNADPGDDSHHCHAHPIFSSLPTARGLASPVAVPGGPILQPAVGFLSRTPPLLDRPPLARA